MTPAALAEIKKLLTGRGHDLAAELVEAWFYNHVDDAGNLYDVDVDVEEAA